MPADILIMSYRDGVDWGFDVTVKSPLSLRIRKEAAVRVLAAADRGVALKYDSYHGEHENRSFKFQPLGLEALGGMHPVVLRLIRTFAKRIGGQWGSKWTAVERRIRREMSILLMKYAAMKVQRRVLKCEP